MVTAATQNFAHSDELELRVLHGPQAGASLPLEQGQVYTLGSGDSCEILLAGLQVESEHATLTVLGQSVRVTPAKGRVTTLDRHELLEAELVPLGTVLQMGRVKLVVDRKVSPWPQDDALEVQTEVAVPVEEAEPPIVDEVVADVPAEVEETLPMPRRRSRRFALSIAGVVLLFAILVGAAWEMAVDGEVNAADSSSSPTGASPLKGDATASETTATLPTLDIEAIARAFPEATLRSERLDQGTWVVLGRVPSEDSRRRLRDAVAVLPLIAEVKVLLDSERLSAAGRFVEKYHLPGSTELKVELGPAYALRITGAIAVQSSLTSIVEQAKKELADSGPLEFSILLPQDLRFRFDERLKASGIYSKFKFIRREPDLLLQAVLSASEVKIWESLFAEFTRTFGTVLTIRADVKAERDQLESMIETVVGGAFPYLVTTTGHRVTPGGMLEGRTVVSIRDGDIVFSDGLKVRFSTSP